MVLEIGRVVVKTAGREAGRVGVVVDIVDRNFVIIDGDLKRRKVNVKHIEPTPKKLDIPKGADTRTVVEKMIEAGIKVSLWKLKRDNLKDLADKLIEKFPEVKEDLERLKATGRW